jgi:hypothetical protein
MYFLANEHETPVQPIDEEELRSCRSVEILFAAQRNGNLRKNSGAHTTEQCVPRTTIVIHCLAPQKSRVKTCSISSKTEG